MVSPLRFGLGEVSQSVSESDRQTDRQTVYWLAKMKRTAPEAARRMGEKEPNLFLMTAKMC